MQTVDTILHAKWLIPMSGEATVLEDHSLVIQAGKIIDLLPHAACRRQYTADDTRELLQHALMPGLINAHTHASMNLLRGYADDLALMDWLQNHIWPAEAKYVSPDFVYDGTQLAIAESLRAGVTCFNDMYFFPDEAARAVGEAGFRACIGMIVIDFPTVWAANADEYLSKGLALHESYRQHERISLAFAPHAPYTVSDEPLKKIVAYAEELDVPIHMHVHETEFEVQQAVKDKGMRELERLQRLGLLSPRLLAVHMTQLDAGEIRLCAENRVNVVHCPESNMKLASGFCPVQELLDAGVNVCIGTDGAASNNDLDMLSEIRSAALMAKLVAKNPSAVPAYQALEMATVNAAKALGIGDITGSLSIGKAADVIAVDLHGIETQPVFHPVSQIVYSCNREQVSHVWVAGQCLLEDRKLTTLNEQALLSKAQAWEEKLKEFS